MQQRYIRWSTNSTSSLHSGCQSSPAASVSIPTVLASETLQYPTHQQSLTCYRSDAYRYEYPHNSPHKLGLLPSVSKQIQSIDFEPSSNTFAQHSPVSKPAISGAVELRLTRCAVHPFVHFLFTPPNPKHEILATTHEVIIVSSGEQVFRGGGTKNYSREPKPSERIGEGPSSYLCSAFPISSITSAAV
jgi:hypothetical protein